MSAVISKKQKKKKVRVEKLEEYLNSLLKNYGIDGEYNIPDEPDFEGDYFIVITPKNKISIDRAIDISTKINLEIHKKFGSNIYINIIPK
ncbi:MAG: hypothetical protein GXO22_06690 [Aquificae bacterium]|nr:hypothetical protein [Aquificota bacterium]